MSSTKIELILAGETAYRALCGDEISRQLVLDAALRALRDNPPKFEYDYPVKRVATEPAIEREGARLRIAFRGISWIVQFNSDDWAAHVETSLRRDLEHSRSYIDDWLDLESRFAEQVRSLQHFIQRYTVGLKWMYEGVDDAFGVVQG